MSKSEREIPSVDKVKEHYFADCQTVTARADHGTINIKFGKIVDAQIPDKTRADLFLSVSLPYAEALNLVRKLTLILSRPDSNAQHYIRKEDQDPGEGKNRIES